MSLRRSWSASRPGLGPTATRRTASSHCRIHTWASPIRPSYTSSRSGTRRASCPTKGLTPTGPLTRPEETLCWNGYSLTPRKNSPAGPYIPGEGTRHSALRLIARGGHAGDILPNRPRRNASVSWRATSLREVRGRGRDEEVDCHLPVLRGDHRR